MNFLVYSDEKSSINRIFISSNFFKLVVMIDNKKKKILIIRLSSLGDVLLTYPLIKILKERENEPVIYFLVKEKFAQAIETNPFIDGVIQLNERNQKEVKSFIKNENFDIVIDLQNNFRSHQLYPFSLKTRIYRFKKPSLKKFLLVNFKINFLKNNKSIALQYIRTVYPELDLNQLPLYFEIPKEYELRADNLLPEHFKEKVLIGICPGSKHFTKRYPVDLFVQVIKTLIQKDYSIALFGGSNDKEICKSLEIDSAAVKNFQNENDLFETAALMKKCSAIITNDSGLMHLSSLLKIPTVAIFGSTIKEFGFAPIFEKSIIVENENLDCRPCSHIGKSSCPKKHFKCMRDITPDLIVQKLEELITKGN
ncbi:MAG: glycosyltransferase family 9 protein [Ignavibacteria bacterium]|nr:glycosyltransferase family 9 protein [Ignavibacteria bacterium]